MLLAVMTVAILSLAFFSRWRLARREEKMDKIGERLGELIISYISGDLSIEFIRQVLKKRMDYIVMMKMIQSLGEALEGKEEERLQELMDLESVRNHFLKRLESGNSAQQAKACLYFSRKRLVKERIRKTLVSLTLESEPLLAYAASMAVVVHGRVEEKAEALRTSIYHEGLSDMAISDLFVRFTKQGDEYHQEEMRVITELIREESLPSKRKALLIRILDELDYFHSVDFLTRFYRELDQANASPPVLVALIHVLTKFGVEEILRDVHRIYAVSDDVRIRETAAWSMGFFLHPESLPILKWMINDQDFRVRFQAVTSLCNYPDIKPEQIRSVVIGESEMAELIGEITGRQ